MIQPFCHGRDAEPAAASARREGRLTARIAVRLTPRASRDAITGFQPGAGDGRARGEVLAVRVTDGTWDQLQAGDVANLNGSGSIFAVADLDDTLRERCRELDIHPTGPMWGGAGTSAQGAVAALEQTVADRYSVLATGLMAAGLESERRALRMQVGALRWSVEDDAVKLQFRLPRGAYATVVLHELLSNAFTQPLGEDSE